MKRITSILLALVLILSSVCAVFADTLTDTSAQQFASVKFNDGVAASYPDEGAVLFEKDGKISVLIKGLDNPTGLAVDSKGDLYVAETGKNKIYKVAEDTLKMTEYKTGLTEPMGLSYSDGKLYIAETGKNRIVYLEGTTLKELAGIVTAADTSGEYTGGYVDGLVAKAEFDHPQGVYADAGVVYVSDTNNHSIRKIANGRVYTVWANRDLSGQLVKPGHLWIENSILYVKDRYLKQDLSMAIVANKFSDVKTTEWYADYVLEANERKLAVGRSNTIFAPEASLTRAEFIQMLANVYLISDGNTVINGDSTFTDVESSRWYAKTLAWAGDMKIIEAGTAFRPNEKITRQDMFYFLYNYAVAVGAKTSDRADLSAYTDNSKISSYALDAFKWTVANKIVSGFGGSKANTLAPLEGATRAQAVKILVEYMDNL